ncbi:MAG: hypothetical protein WCT12_23785 [Verrucomicrobiota bacterium]
MFPFSINLSEQIATCVIPFGIPLTWVPTQIHYLAISVAALVISWLATRDLDNQFKRWLMIFATVGLSYLVLKAMGHFQAVKSPEFIGIVDMQAYGEAVEMLLCACLGTIIVWTDTLSGFAANSVTGILYPNETAHVTHDFRPVERLMREGKSRAAMSQLKRMRVKTPEALLIRARIHENLDEVSAARAIYKRLLRSPASASHLTISTLLARLS